MLHLYARWPANPGFAPICRGFTRFCNLATLKLARYQQKTHPVLVYNIRDDHELSILLPVVDKSHTPDLDVPGERHPVESSEIRP